MMNYSGVFAGDVREGNGSQQSLRHASLNDRNDQPRKSRHVTARVKIITSPSIHFDASVTTTLRMDTPTEDCLKSNGSDQMCHQ